MRPKLRTEPGVTSRCHGLIEADADMLYGLDKGSSQLKSAITGESLDRDTYSSPQQAESEMSVSATLAK